MLPCPHVISKELKLMKNLFRWKANSSIHESFIYYVRGKKREIDYVNLTSKKMVGDE